jgi:YfiH family protein
LRCRPLSEIADHFFTDATLTLRDSEQEWQQVARLADVPVDRLRLLSQVHGTRVVTVKDRSDAWVPPQADGAITQDRSAALVVRVADCAPILLADRRTGAVAAVHAGWRSTMQGIATLAVDLLRTDSGVDPADIVAAIGPSLGPCCGEMGEEVVQAFAGAGHPDADLQRWFLRAPGRRPHFDLWTANRDQLERAGVPAGQIHSANLCTRTYADAFHSYRAHGAGAGRMAAVIRARGHRAR